MRFAAFLCASLALAGAAFAQNGEWRDATGQIRLTLSANGWAQRESPFSPSPPHTRILSAVPRDGSDPLCELEYVTQGGAPALSRERINEGTRRLLTSPAFEAMRSEPGYTLERAEVVDIDGVAVLDAYGRYGPLATVMRRFLTQEGSGELRLYTLTCSAVAENAAGVTSMRTVAASIRFSDAPQ